MALLGRHELFKNCNEKSEGHLTPTLSGLDMVYVIGIAVVRPY